MKTILIPYNYQAWPDTAYLTLNTFNIGLSLCKRLGYTCVEILIGRKEWKEVQDFAASHTVLTGIKLLERYSYKKVTKTTKTTEITFKCKATFPKYGKKNEVEQKPSRRSPV